MTIITPSARFSASAAIRVALRLVPMPKVFGEGRVLAAPSLLLRSAFADAVTLRDPANNLKLAKARSNGRIDAAAASVLAVAEGARITGRAQKKQRVAIWA